MSSFPISILRLHTSGECVLAVYVAVGIFLLIKKQVLVSLLSMYTR